MDDTTMLKILTPDSIFYEKEITSLVVDEPGGKEGFLPGHEAVMKLLSDGDAKIREKDGAEKTCHVSGGYLIVSDEMLIFTSGASWKDEKLQ